MYIIKKKMTESQLEIVIFFYFGVLHKKENDFWSKILHIYY